MTYKIIQVDDESGEEIELETLPTELVKSSKEYQEVLQESIMRRQKLAELKKKLSEQEPPNQPNNSEDVVTPKQETPVIDLDSLRREIVTAVVSELKQQEAIALSRQAAVQSVMQKYNIPSELADIVEAIYISDSQNLEAKAQKLAKTVLPNAGIGGNTQTATPETIVSNIMSRLMKG